MSSDDGEMLLHSSSLKLTGSESQKVGAAAEKTKFQCLFQLWKQKVDQH